MIDWNPDNPRSITAARQSGNIEPCPVHILSRGEVTPRPPLFSTWSNNRPWHRVACNTFREKSVADYVSGQLLATDFEGSPISAAVYIMPMDKLSGSSKEYAISLAAVARKTGLPEDYIVEIESCIEIHV